MKGLFYCLSTTRRNCKLPGPRRFESIMQFVEYGENIMQKVTQKADEFKKGELYPFIVVALMEGNPHRFYLSVFDIIYQFDDLVTTLDYLFKSFFVFNIKYPNDAYNVLLFLQQFFYSLYLKEDCKYSTIIDFMDKLAIASTQ